MMINIAEKRKELTQRFDDAVDKIDNEIVSLKQKRETLILRLSAQLEVLDEFAEFADGPARKNLFGKDGERPRKMSVLDKVSAAISREPMSVRELVDQTCSKHKSVYSSLSKLSRSGKLKKYKGKDGRRVYVLSSPPLPPNSSSEVSGSKDSEELKHKEADDKKAKKKKKYRYWTDDEKNLHVKNTDGMLYSEARIYCKSNRVGINTLTKWRKELRANAVFRKYQNDALKKSRSRILSLCKDPQTSKNISKLIDMSRSRILQHLQELKKEGKVTVSSIGTTLIYVATGHTSKPEDVQHTLPDRADIS